MFPAVALGTNSLLAEAVSQEFVPSNECLPSWPALFIHAFLPESSGIPDPDTCILRGSARRAERLRMAGQRLSVRRAKTWMPAFAGMTWKDIESNRHGRAQSRPSTTGLLNHQEFLIQTRHPEAPAPSAGLEG
jgi:hypothetical protein